MLSSTNARSFLGGSGSSRNSFLIGGAVVVLLLVLGYMSGIFSNSSISDFLSFSSDPAKDLRHGGGAGEGGGLAESLDGKARADTYQPDKASTKARDNDPQTAFDPEANEMDYGTDMQQLNQRAWTYPYNN